MRQDLRERMHALFLAASASPRRLHTRVLVLAAGGLAAVGVGAGVAVARTSSAPIGTGVVVIDTNLAYQGGAAAGTGMVLTPSGEVLTNNHVIKGATSIKVVLPGTNRAYTAKVVGYDLADDVAVLQAAGASNLKTASTGNSSSVKVGDAVTALGNANGTGTLTPARGSVTALQRSILVSDEQGGGERLSGLIETNAGLQPGDSGGPLYNSAGKVIGMDTAASTQYVFQSTASQGYAIPIAKALSIAKQIESGKASARVHVGGTAFLGIEVQPATDAGGASAPGALIANVVPGGPAASAGLSAGDVITAIDGHAVSSPSAITSLLLTEKPGAKVTIVFSDQSGASQTATVTLGSGPAQ